MATRHLQPDIQDLIPVGNSVDALLPGEPRTERALIALLFGATFCSALQYERGFELALQYMMQSITLCITECSPNATLNPASRISLLLNPAYSVSIILIQ